MAATMELGFHLPVGVSRSVVKVIMVMVMEDNRRNPLLLHLHRRHPPPLPPHVGVTDEVAAIVTPVAVAFAVRGQEDVPPLVWVVDLVVMMIVNVAVVDAVVSLVVVHVVTIAYYVIIVDYCCKIKRKTATTARPLSIARNHSTFPTTK
jgi:hypothetical protein